MGNLPRIQEEGLYHVSTQAVAGSWLFLDEFDYEARLAMLAKAVERGQMRLHAHCLMGTHEHLLFSVAEGVLGELMRRLNRAYAGAFNQAHRRKGRLYSSPYESRPVRSNRYLKVLIAYLALNPELAGLGRAESHRWSSYPALIGVLKPIPFIDPTPLYEAVGGGPDAPRRIADLVRNVRAGNRAA